MHVGYIHYSRPCRARDAGAARAETRTAHRRTLGARREDDRCRGSRYAVCERGTLDIIISNGSNEPIYEQITRQIKAAIMAGDVNEGDPLPSIRALANDLRISVITTKRAYAELEEAGFIDTVQGKGSFVAGGNLELLREERLRGTPRPRRGRSGKRRHRSRRSARHAGCAAGRKLNEERT